MKSSFPVRGLVSSAVLLLSACAGEMPMANGEEPSFTKVEPGKEDSSAEAVFIDLDFDGELDTDRSWSPNQQIEDQLMYTIGLLNGERGVIHLDNLVISDVRTTPVGGRYRITYHARLPAAYGRRSRLPTELVLRLPRDVSSAGLTRFASTYGHSCVEAGAHDVDSGSMWYYYRPARSGCSFAEGDIVTTTAGITLSSVSTTGRFPEYDKIWEDSVLRVVAVFGKYEDGATSSSDAGIEAYNRFIGELRTAVGSGATVTTVPASIPRQPGVANPDVTFTADLGNGRSVEVVSLLVDNVREAGPTFDQRFALLSTRADLIVYNGHAGLGTNVRALARKGRWTAGQYAIAFLNGCDSYAYVDDALWTAHAAVNSDDPRGTRHMDIVTNAMPAYFSSMPRATVAMIRGLMSIDQPRTYEQIFADIDSSQVVLVSGEEDNAFQPGGGDPTPPTEAWTGLMENGSVDRNGELSYATPTLPAGRYSFSMTGTGDADLHVRIGAAATRSAYDCRPYRSDANESCDIELTAPAAVHVLVHGYTASTFALTGATR